MPLRDSPARRDTRLPGWDYRSTGPYAITIVSQHREWFFGGVTNGNLDHSTAGEMVKTVWSEMVVEYPRVSLDAFVLMPNHLHAIVYLSQDGPAGNPTLSDVVQRFKSITTARYSTGVREYGWQPYDRKLWQRNYYDHIVKDRADLERCRRYIVANPRNWLTDPDREPERNPPEPGRRL